MECGEIMNCTGVNSGLSNKPPFHLAYTRHFSPKGGEGIAGASTESPFPAPYGGRMSHKGQEGGRQNVWDTRQWSLTLDLSPRNSFDQKTSQPPLPPKKYHLTSAPRVMNLFLCYYCMPAGVSVPLTSTAVSATITGSQRPIQPKRQVKANHEIWKYST